MTSSRRWWTLGAMCIALAMGMLDSSVVAVALNRIQVDLGIPLSELDWIVNAYVLAVGSLLVVGGRLGDLYGRKRWLLIGLALFTGSSILCGLARSGGMLVVSRALQGAGGAILLPCTMSIVSSAFPPSSRGTAMGTWAAVSGWALALGPVVGGVVTQSVGWRSIFWLNVPLAIVTAVIVLWATDESRDESAVHGLDWAGAALSAGALGLLLYALDVGLDWGWTSAAVIGLFAAVAALAGAFVWVERRVAQPLLELDLLRSQGFLGATVVGFMLSIVLMCTFVFIPLYCQEVLHSGPLQAGWQMLPLTITAAFIPPFAGRMADRLGPRVPIGIGMAMSAVALAWLATQARTAVTYDALLLPLSLQGLGVALVFTPMITAGMNSVEDGKAGAASGTLAMVRSVGSALGIAVFATVFQVMLEGAKGSGLAAGPAFAGAFADGAWMLAGVSSVGMVAGIAVLKPGPDRKSRVRHVITEG